MTDMIQDSYDALMFSTSRDPQHLIGYQDDPQLKQQQHEYQKAEWKAAKAPINLRDVLKQKGQQNMLEQLVQKKRARELTSSDAACRSLNLSPTQLRKARKKGIFGGTPVADRGMTVRCYCKRRGASAAGSSIWNTKLRH